MKIKFLSLPLLLLLLIILPFQIKSQTSVKTKPSFWSQTSVGFFGGANLQKLIGSAPIGGSYSGNLSSILGISLETKIYKDIKLVLQPNYTNISTAINVDINRTETVDSFTVDMSFYRIPVLANLKHLTEFHIL